MRIAVFTDSYRPYTSGVVRSIETFSEELDALGHRVHIFAPRYGPLAGVEDAVYRFYSFPSPTNPEFNIAIPISLRLKATLRRLGVDIIHVHSPFMLGRMGARSARDLGLPLVFTYHTLYDHYVHYIPLAQNFTRKVTQHLCAQFSNRCDQVLVPTNVIGDYIRDLGVTVPIRKLPTGINLEQFQNGDPLWFRERFSIAADEKVLLFVGRIGLEKNLAFLLRSFQIVCGMTDNRKVRLFLVGGGPETESLTALSRDLGISDQVVFAGPVSGSEVAHCCAGSDLFVFPSITETQGLVIGEAKAAGLPSVAVNAFGVGEMVIDGEDGFLVEPNESEFAERVGMLLHDDHLLRQFADNARRNAEQLSSRIMARELVSTYEELIASNRSINYSAQ
ncbi:MAG: glycosyltransferase family 4 protein [Eubacteriales bacterium]|nr:glycosyltransferase family 4 protein [Bacillota bacterium]MBV1726854.1 glycosyltransferase family 4 protein [Desulforudis sp.]MDQ7789052.1 glycosyltransferase family 4 protein [Clostridia bacterium]MDZ4043066.1 glycosyltransferase family 4 protein [Eubacteriales bacterium]MBU4555107.1 glycosyltransferase family 4 protein [Bacillota bacterium]